MSDNENAVTCDTCHATFQWDPDTERPASVCQWCFEKEQIEQERDELRSQLAAKTALAETVVAELAKLSAWNAKHSDLVEAWREAAEECEDVIPWDCDHLDDPRSNYLTQAKDALAKARALEAGETKSGER
jgi:hypothetical protein